MKPQCNVALITTVNHNVGDDLVREGICFLLRNAIGEFETSFIHKHIPITVRPEFEWVYSSGLTRALDLLPRGRGTGLSKALDVLPLNRKTDKVLNCDLLVQCGAPVYWCFANGHGSHENEWYKPLIKRRYELIKDRVPFLNVGAGTCQPFFSDGREFNANTMCSSYIAELHKTSTATTVRDTLSKTILNNFGLDAPTIPCPSLFARDYHGLTPKNPEYGALNFMPFGGHYDLNHGIDTKRWLKVFGQLIEQVKRISPVILVCHDRNEADAAQKNFPGTKCFVSRSSQGLMDFYSRASFFLGSRVHGAYAVASFGRPAFVVGSDTRARMMEQIGGKYGFVEDVSANYLLIACQEMLKLLNKYEEEVSVIRNNAFTAYMNVLISALSNRPWFNSSKSRGFKHERAL